MANILYISYTGMLEPLGQSQVVQYMKGLSATHKITILSYEKNNAIKNTNNVLILERALSDLNINWIRLKYHNKPNLAGTLYDVFRGIMVCRGIIKAHKIDIIHCRSYVASMIGLFCKNKYGTKFIFDMRGFWPDERVDGGIWKKNGLIYNGVKNIEKKYLIAADHIVSLTNSGANEIRKNPIWENTNKKISVIPTCTNLNLFDIESERRASEDIWLGYIGSVGSWYLFDQVARVAKILMNHNSRYKFLVISKGDHQLIKNNLISHGCDFGRIKILSASYEEMPQYISQISLGLFFIKPSWSKRASCPTRMGEFLASGIPCISNGGVGDVEDIVKNNNIGIILEVVNDVVVIDNEKNFVLEVDNLLRMEGISGICKNVAKNIFSLEIGIAKYNEIYLEIGK